MPSEQDLRHEARHKAESVLFTHGLCGPENEDLVEGVAEAIVRAWEAGAASKGGIEK